MERINSSVQFINKIGIAIASAFLFINAFLIVVNAVTRGFGHSITGAHELIVLFIVPSVAFALFQATLEDGHVAVTFLRNRLSQRAQAFLGRFVWLVTLLWWVLITWAGIDIMLEKWLLERTELLEVPYLPFRLVWIFALVFICLAAAFYLCRPVKEGAGK